MVSIKNFLLGLTFLSIAIGVYFAQQKNMDLAYYNKQVQESVRLSTQGSEQEKVDFANNIANQIKDNPKDLRWKQLYSTILVDYFKDDSKAITVMEEIYQQHQDNHILIGICLLKEKINLPYKACYEKVLNQVTQPYYDDLNYWAAIGGLAHSYSEQDIEKSALSQEVISHFITKDRQTLLNSMF